MTNFECEIHKRRGTHIYITKMMKTILRRCLVTQKCKLERDKYICKKEKMEKSELTLEIQMTKRRGRATIYHNKKKYPSREWTMLQPNSQPCRQCKRQFIFNINEPKKEVGPLLTEKENK